MKTLALAALIAAATAAPVAAAPTDGFGSQRSVESAGFVDLDLVRTQSGGHVEIIDGTSLSDSALLGAETVRAGLESHVRVQLEHKPFRDHVTAVLYDTEGHITATRELRVID